MLLLLLLLDHSVLCARSEWIQRNSCGKYFLNLWTCLTELTMYICVDLAPRGSSPCAMTNTTATRLSTKVRSTKHAETLQRGLERLQAHFDEHALEYVTVCVTSVQNKSNKEFKQ